MPKWFQRNFVVGNGAAQALNATYPAIQKFTILADGGDEVPDDGGHFYMHFNDDTLVGKGDKFGNYFGAAFIPDSLRCIPIIIDAGASVISTGVKGIIPITYPLEIVKYEIFANVSGSIVIDLWEGDYSTYSTSIPDNTTSICDNGVATTPIEIDTDVKGTDSTLANWTKTFPAGSILRTHVDSCTSINKILLSLWVKERALTNVVTE